MPEGKEGQGDALGDASAFEHLAALEDVPGGGRGGCG